MILINLEKKVTIYVYKRKGKVFQNEDRLIQQMMVFEQYRLRGRFINDELPFAVIVAVMDCAGLACNLLTQLKWY